LRADFKNIDIGFLSDFLKQSQTGNLKTKGLYPESILDLDVKVSFGMGTPTHVPWISLLGPGMSTSNGYYPVYLFYKKEGILILTYGLSETVKFNEPWSREIVEQNQTISEFLEQPFRYGDSYVFKTYEIEFHDDEIKFMSDGIELGPNELSKDLDDIVSEYKNCMEITVKDESSDLSKGLFYMEQQLEDFIIQNWDESEFGKKYDLIEEDGVLKSQQYRTDIGPIDILAIEKGTNNFVVIELKRNQSSDDTVGQIARYMGWVEEHLECENVKGVIVCGKYDKKLDYARKRVRDVEVFLYEVNFSLKEYKK
jgi:CRISPR/Cas system-associated exonuclease Cas4 (RecB family)